MLVLSRFWLCVWSCSISISGGWGVCYYYSGWRPTPLRLPIPSRKRLSSAPCPPCCSWSAWEKGLYVGGWWLRLVRTECLNNRFSTGRPDPDMERGLGWSCLDCIHGPEATLLLFQPCESRTLRTLIRREDFVLLLIICFLLQTFYSNNRRRKTSSTVFRVFSISYRFRHGILRRLGNPGLRLLKNLHCFASNSLGFSVPSFSSAM